MSDDNPRLDVLLVATDRRHRLWPPMAVSLIRYLDADGIATPVAESVADEWVEVYLAPRPTAHSAFVKGAWTGDGPAFVEAVVRFGSRPEPLPYGGEGTATTWIEFRGSVLGEPSAEFRKKIADLFRLRTEVFSRPHEPPPPHREVPEDELPKEPEKRKGPSSGAVGTRVEDR
ncbi:MAG: hypothetical protein FJ087_09645 [Deltaproteobacteria bacterium]|nr:hypothetical protein [Deltaproteobacteria bacterium]